MFCEFAFGISLAKASPDEDKEFGFRVDEALPSISHISQTQLLTSYPPCKHKGSRKASPFTAEGQSIGRGWVGLIFFRRYERSARILVKDLGVDFLPGSLYLKHTSNSDDLEDPPMPSRMATFSQCVTRAAVF